MRHALYVVLILTLMLAGCGGGDSPPTESGPTIAPVPTTDENAPPDPDMDEDLAGAALDFDEVVSRALHTQEPFVRPSSTPDPDGGLEVPLPRTLVASETQEVEPIGGFQVVTFEQRAEGESSGPMLVIYADGRVSRGGQEGRLEPADIQQLNDAISDLNFFGLQGTFLGPPGGEGTFIYRVAIETETVGRAINAQNGYMPEQLTVFLGLIRSMGEKAVQSG
jgi:hypothetical protein